MKTKYTLFRRGKIYYSQDSATGQQKSLRTRDEAEALQLINARNEAHRQPVLNLHLARAYAAVPDRKFQTIDGMVSHSWYLEDSIWYDDLAYTLKGQLDRNLIPTRTRVGDNDFVLKTSV
jgi:hypothetical protein